MSFSMRRLLTFALLLMGLCMLPAESSAQFNLGKAFNKLIGNDDAPSPYEKIAENAPEQSRIVGTWKYKDADVEYLGDNMLADYAVSQLDDYATSYLNEFGIREGAFSVQFKRNGLGTVVIDGMTFSGSYTYDKSKGSMLFNGEYEGMKASCRGYVKYSDKGYITLLIDARDLCKIYRKYCPEGIDDKLVEFALDVIEEYSGIYVSVEFSKSR